MYVLLGQIDGVLDSPDILIGLVELVVFQCGALELLDHLPSQFDSLGYHLLKFSGQLLQLPLHVLDDLWLDASTEFALDLDLLIGQLCEVVILLL